VEFVGVLSRAPELAAAPDEGLWGGAAQLYEEEMAARPLTSQVGMTTPLVQQPAAACLL